MTKVYKSPLKEVKRKTKEIRILGAWLQETKDRFIAVSRKTKNDKTLFMHELAVDIMGANANSKVLFVDFHDSQYAIQSKLLKALRRLSTEQTADQLLAELQDIDALHMVSMEEMNEYLPKAKSIVEFRLRNLIDQIFQLKVKYKHVFVLVRNPEGLADDLQHDQLEAQVRLWKILDFLSQSDDIKVVISFAQKLNTSRAYTRSEKSTIAKIRSSKMLGDVQSLGSTVGKVQWSPVPAEW